MSLFERTKLFIDNILADINRAYANMTPDSREGREVLEMKDALEELHKKWEKAALEARENYQAAGGMNFSEKGVDTNVKFQGREKNSPNYDSETASVIEQIRHNTDILNSMDNVASVVVPQKFKDKYTAAQWAIGYLKNTGYKVDRQGFGIVYFNEKDIKHAVNYADTDAEKAAFSVIGKVIKRGKIIGEHNDHKQRGKHTVTIAAPVEINGIQGIVGAVINLNGNHYYMHRIVLPNGTSFVFPNEIIDIKKETRQESYRGVTNNGSLADTTSLASNNNISQEKSVVNNHSTQKSKNDTKFSDRATTESDSDELYSRLRAKQQELNEVTEKKLAIEKSEEYQSMVDEMVSSDATPEAINKYSAWAEKTGYNSIAKRVEALTEEIKKDREVYNKVVKEVNSRKEAQAIAESGLSEADYFRKLAVEEFGYTPYFNDAAYILPDGRMLNFSGEKGKHFGRRGKDHRAIGVIYETVSGGEAMTKFMNEGNVRIMVESPGIDIGTDEELTVSQYNTISRFIYEYAGKRRRFFVDFTNSKGKLIGSLEYDGDVSSREVVYDIKDYFKSSKVREQNKWYSDRNYTYDALVSKPDMKITAVDTANVPNNRADVIAQAKKNASKIGKFNPKDGSVSVHVDDIDTDVVLTSHGLAHGLRRSKDITKDSNSIVALKSGEIISNSIRINELIPSKTNVNSSYALIGIAKDNDNIYFVRTVINSYSNEVESIDALYAINTKKESAVLNAPAITNNSLRITDSTISIADLLEFVNSYFPDVLPEDVLKHYGYDARPNGKLGESALYSDRITAKDDASFIEDKYYARRIQSIEDAPKGGYITVGTIKEKSPLNLVGIAEGTLYFDVSKVLKSLGEHGDHLSKELIKAVPKVLNNPIAITEYKVGRGENTVSVYGNVYTDKGIPIVVGVMMSYNIQKGTIIDKVRTVHARSDFASQITDESILYLGENKKETKTWFQALDIDVPLGETKFGFIRSIQYSETIVNSLSKNNSKNLHQDRAETSGSNRALLANALEETIDTSTQVGKNQLKMLGRYKSEIALLDDLNLQLNEVKQEIKATDKKDKVTLAKLNAQAKALADQISREDKKLLKIEATRPIREILEMEKKKATAKQREKDADILKRRNEGKTKTEMRHKIRKQFKCYVLLFLIIFKSKSRKVFPCGFLVRGQSRFSGAEGGIRTLVHDVQTDFESAPL